MEVIKLRSSFKFRAWDRELKCLDNTCVATNLLTDFNENSLSDDDFNRFIIMQCTGLKDKNGKLIFEGDILSGLISLMEVVFNKGAFGYLYHDMFFPFAGCPYLDRFLEDKEIVGNIYENRSIMGCMKGSYSG